MGACATLRVSSLFCQSPSAVRHEREISNAGRYKLDFAERDECKPVLLGLSLAWKSGQTTFVPLYGTEWRERGYGLRATLPPFGPIKGQISSNWFKIQLCPSIWLYPESKATLPPFGPIEGHKWFFHISNQWESQKNRSALSLSAKSSFDHPASEITCSCRTASACSFAVISAANMTTFKTKMCEPELLFTCSF